MIDSNSTKTDFGLYLQWLIVGQRIEHYKVLRMGMFQCDTCIPKHTNHTMSMPDSIISLN